MSPIDTPDLSTLLLNQIRTGCTVLCIQFGMVVISNLIIVRLINLLLEQKLLKVIKGNNTVGILCVTASIVLESKAFANDDLLGSKWNINTGILGSTLHLSRFMDGRHKLPKPLLFQGVKGLRGIVSLLIDNGINDLVGQAQFEEHPGNRSPIGSSK